MDITIPHTWNAVDGQQGSQRKNDENQNAAKGIKLIIDSNMKYGYFRGKCWYSHLLEIPGKYKGKRVFILFEAASIVARTYINGHALGEHKGAFTAFCYELTPYLNYDGPNEIRVQVDNTYNDNIPPLSGDFNMDGGLYRPVHFLVADAICISPLNFASPGIYISTKNLTYKKTSIAVRSLISNGTSTKKRINLETTIIDMKGKVASVNKSSLTINARQTLDYKSELTVVNPHLWNGVKCPYLYSVKVKVRQNGKITDELMQPLGIRTFSVSQDKGFLLNGQPYPIHGVGYHQDKRNEGWALTTKDRDEDIKTVLDMGATAIRFAHYPQSQYVNKLCDQKGLLMWEEASLVNETRSTPEFKANSELEMREMVLQLYNHPGIAFWGIYNELENLPTPPSEDLLKNLKSIAKKLDPYRIIVAASDHGNRYYNTIPDEIAFNNYPGWYGSNWPKEENYKGRLDQMAEFIDYRAKEVGKRIAIAEYGAGGDPNQHKEGPPAKTQPGPRWPVSAGRMAGLCA
jgi:beta-galactosidase